MYEIKLEEPSFLRKKSSIKSLIIIINHILVLKLTFFHQVFAKRTIISELARQLVGYKNSNEGVLK